MKIGTKSVLFGVHQFFLHPILVALAWWRLYGFPWDIRLWFAFFLHDLGYIGKPNIDGPEGEKHPEWAAKIMGKLFGSAWGDFCLCHSRFYARKNGLPFSRLCVADKWSITLYPNWLFLLLARWSGELNEYMGAGRNEISGTGKTPQVWFADLQLFLRNWVRAHKGREYDETIP